MTRIAIGCDHRGFALKELVMPFLQKAGHSYQDFGCYSTEPVDYPDIARKVGEAVASGNFDHGILICDTGIGMSIAANKIKGIRAALCRNAFAAQRARQHNDANILCLRAEDMDNKSALEIVEAFLATDFEGGRHVQRVSKIRALEGDTSE
jgi:ribose 5-phosphate isomerase B